MDEWFSTGLLKWYRQNKRDLPWRNTSDPYRIWLSEIILQQTQVIQGLSYYHKFTETYPAITDLARASEDEVLKLWQGLGYYSRARNLLFTARLVAEQHGGIFPENYLEIKALKGIGDYTAAAIASFAFGLPHAVVDGNVYRLLSRVFGIEIPIDSGPAKKQFAELASQLLDRKNPALHNQAIMEFGSQFCRPVKPDCPACIFKARCLAFKEGRVAELPLKTKKIKVTKRYFNYLVISDGKGHVLTRRRNEKDIWQGLYEFVLLETENAATPEALLSSEAAAAALGKTFKVKSVSKTYKHVLSHQVLMARFFLIEAKNPKVAQGLEKTDLKKLQSLGLPRLIEKYLDDCGLKEIF